MGFHEGEMATQRRAGVQREASRLEGMLGSGELRGGFGRFLADRTFAAITARDARGRLWVSPLTGPAGFLEASGPTTLVVHTTPVAGDPLHQLPPGQPVGLVVIEFGTRRRVRINGTLSAIAGEGLRVEVEQAYGNCPQYIQQRVLKTTGAPASTVAVRRGLPLTADDGALIRSADTFFIGTTHPTRGNDASHRGGPAGFLRVDGSQLWWPDYSGNNMFNTLGNLAVDPTAALLVPDFATGITVQMSGTAATEWTATGVPGDDDSTGRRVRFDVEDLVVGRLLPLHAVDVVPYGLNPPLTH
jgi:hypothetical protein